MSDTAGGPRLFARRTVHLRLETMLASPSTSLDGALF